MSNDRYPAEVLDPNEDDGMIVENAAQLASSVVGRRIVSAEGVKADRQGVWGTSADQLVLTLDDNTQVALRGTDDCCAYTELKGFWIDPSSVDHVILGVGTTEEYTVWHIYADFGDVMRLNVGWSCGNPFYYGYGFDITVKELETS